MRRKLTLEYIEEYAESIGGKLGKNKKYINNEQKLQFICAKCGKPYMCNFIKFEERQKIYCNECSLIEKGMRRRIDYEVVRKTYEEYGFALLEKEYENCEHPMKCKDRDGYIGYIHFANVKSGYGIGKFNSTNPSYLFNLNHFCKINDYDCKVLNWYKDKKQMVTIKCSCGNIYTTLAVSFLHQKCYRCTECSKKKSKYALKVSKFLNKIGITYIEEKMFDDCRNVLPLPFDFCVLLDGVFFLIEVDGEYHYEPINGEEALQSQIERDKIKTNYCNYNKISLIRIPYWEIENDEFKNKIITEVNRQNQITS
jgi:hypothetical protein